MVRNNNSSRLPKRKGEFTYRGKTIEELQKLNINEFSELLPSRERRSIKRSFEKIYHKIYEDVINDKDVKTHYRMIIILPSFIGKKISVYDGKKFVSLSITPEMIGHRIGEFALTRQKVSHGSAGVGATRSSKFVPLK